MGVIAVARHVELDEPVALKFLKPDIVNADQSGTVASRFVREARATIKIRSEHVPRIFDVTTLDIGVPYIVMELLVGEDLDQCLERQGPLPVPFVVDLLLQSLEALAAAHALGMVHRDFKPANLFLARRLDGSNCVKVLDFGIAKLADRNGTGVDHGLTGTNAVMGSPRYMSPEQMRSARDVDSRADIWAVGTSLYELLTGVAPFDGESLTQVCAAILQDEPLPMGQRRQGIAPELEAVVRRCLAKRAAERYTNVGELAAALAPFGTAATAGEMAARVARVLGTPAVGRASEPSLPSLAVATSGVTAQFGDPSSSGIGVTNTSWGANEATSRASRRRVLTLASVFAALLLIGLVLGGAALLRTRTPIASATAGVVASPSPPPPPPSAALVAAETVPVAVEAPGIALSAAPSSRPAHPKNDAKPVTSTPTKTASPVSNKPTPAPPAGGLWDDRK
jgi:serine/threonine-protein kinase